MKERQVCYCVCSSWWVESGKDTLLLVLGKIFYLAGAAWQLFCYHKQQVGVVYPFGMNQPAVKKDSFVNNLPLLACISHSFANGSARFMRQPYKAHLANNVTISFKNDAGLQSEALFRLLANRASDFSHDLRERTHA